MALEEDVAGVFGEVLEAVVVPVGEEKGFPVCIDAGDFRKEEIGHRLVDLGFAVSLDRDEPVRIGIDQTDDLPWAISFRGHVPGSVIEEIP